MLRFLQTGKKSTAVRYGYALLGAVIALGIRLIGNPFFGSKVPYLTFFFSTVATAVFFGLGPGIVSTLAGAVLARAFLEPPSGSLLYPDPADPSGFVRFLIINLFIAYVCSTLVTSREKARSTEARLQFALETAGMVIWELDPNTNEVIASGGMEQVYGAGVSNANDLIHSDDAARRRKEIDHLIRKGGSYRCEFRTRRGSGWIEERASAVENGGRITRLVGVVIDISERKRVEQALRETEEIYRAVGESIPFGVWICDAEGRSTYVSESFQKLVGMSAGECAGFGWTKALHPDDAQRTLEAWKECVRMGGHWDEEHRFLGTDRRYHHVLGRGVAIHDATGRTVCWAGIHLDIGRLKAAESALQRQTEELIRSNRELEQFAYVASHDMQAPLRVVNIYSELLLRKIETRTPEMDQFAAFIHDGVLKMEHLIRDLLDFSRVVHADVEKVPVDASAALEQALRVCNPLLEEAAAEITYSALPVVMAEEGPLAQVFQNLISNAVKYRNPGSTPRIHISGNPSGTFCVEDNGIGFDPRYAQTIFGLFKRLHNTEVPGNGLGLAICQRIVERYGGKIWAESNSGEGARFFFTLPPAA